MEVKQYATKQSVDHWRNQRGNQKTPRDKWKQKHNDSKTIGCGKSSPKGEVYSNTILPQEVYNLHLHLKQLEKEEEQQQQQQKPQS